MPKTSQAVTLVADLKALLSDRKALRAILPYYKLFLDSRNYNAERERLEAQITAVVVENLTVTEAERQTLPQARHIAECAFHLPSWFGAASRIEQPNLIWNHNPLPGVLTAGWAPNLKQRLLDLCGPLDATLARMLAQ